MDIYRSGHVEMASDQQAKVRLPGEGCRPGAPEPDPALCSTFMASQVKLLQYRSGVVKLNSSFFKNMSGDATLVS